MLILKASDRALYVMRGEGELVRVTAINGAPPHLGQFRSSKTALVLGENPVVKSGPEPLDIVEILEPEGEAGALTRAVLEFRDAFVRDAGLEGDTPESYTPFQRMVALAEAIAESSREPA